MITNSAFYSTQFSLILQTIVLLKSLVRFLLRVAHISIPRVYWISTHFTKRRNKDTFSKQVGTALIWTALTGARSMEWCVHGPMMTNTPLRTYRYINLHLTCVTYHKTGGVYHCVTDTQFRDHLILIHGFLTHRHVMSQGRVMSLVNFVSYPWLAKAKY